MIELLSRLDPATSVFIGSMLDDGNRKKVARKANRCKTCRGRKRVKKPKVLGVRQEYQDCPGCFGSGKSQGQRCSETRTRSKSEIMTPEQIAFSCIDMPDRWYRAAVLHVTHDQAVRQALVADLKKVAIDGSQAWKLSPQMTETRALGLARVASVNLMLRDGDYIDSTQASDLMCCTTRAWQKSWRTRAIGLTSIGREWIYDADRHMVSRMNEAEAA